MGIKAVTAVFELKDEFSKKLKSSSKKSRAEFNKIKKYATDLQSKVSIIFKNIGKVLFAGIGSASVIAGKYINDSLKAYTEQNKAVVALTNSLSKQKGMTKELLQSTIKYGEEVQKNGVIGDEIIQQGMNELAVGGLKAEQIKKLAFGLGDILAKEKGLNATTQDSISVGKSLTQAIISGRVRALASYGIYLTDTEQKMYKLMDTEKRVEFIKNKIQSAVGGMNKSLMSTPEGIKKVYQNAFGDIQEIVGSKIYPMISKISKSLIDKLPKFQNKIIALVDKLGELAPTIEKGVVSAIDLLLKVLNAVISSISFLANNWKWIKPVSVGILGLVGIFKVYSGVMKAYNILQTAMTLAKTLDISITGVLISANTALSISFAVLTSPITVIIVAISALVGAGYLLYKNWDKIKAKASKLWEVFRQTDIFKTWVNIFITIKSVLTSIVGLFDKVVGGVSKLAKSGISKIANFFSGKDNIKKNALGTPYYTGGLTTVNERGGELITLPSGSQIIPHDLSQQMVSSNKAPSYNININIQGNVIGNKDFARQLTTMIVNEVQLSRGNI